MKIAISANGSNLDAEVSNKLGTCEYLLIIDVDSGSFEAISTISTVGQRGAGINVIIFALTRGVRAILTGYCSPGVCNQLKTSGIEVLTGIRGTVREALNSYKTNYITNSETPDAHLRIKTTIVDRNILANAVKSSARQFVSLLPVLIGVVLLLGLFNTFVSKEMLMSVFSGNVLADTFLGACLGSILAGNPITSYIIGGELLKHGVSLLVVTAFIITWVTVGVVQLPAEIAALGKKFALLRNGLSFIFSVPIAMLTVLIINL